MILHVFISSVNVYQCTDSDHPDIQAIQVGEIAIAQFQNVFFFLCFKGSCDLLEDVNKPLNRISIGHDS